MVESVRDQQKGAETDPVRLVLSCAARFREAGIPDARMAALRLLAYVSGRTQIDCLLGECPVLTPDQSIQMEELCQRRTQGEPEQYLTGRSWFMGELFHVGPGVLIPRPDSEILVSEALARMPADNLQNSTFSFADICTGTGCIGLSIARALDLIGIQYKSLLTDCSEAALKYARHNFKNFSPLGEVQIAQCDLFPETFESFDLIVSNPPYIPTADIPDLMPEVSLHEPRMALDGGDDGLHLIRLIVQEAVRRLRTSGWLLLEHGYDQGEAVRRLFLACPGFDKVETIRDFGGNERVTVGMAAGLQV